MPKKSETLKQIEVHTKTLKAAAEALLAKDVEIERLSKENEQLRGGLKAALLRGDAQAALNRIEREDLAVLKDQPQADIEYLRKQLAFCGWHGYRILERTDPPDPDYYSALAITEAAEAEAQGLIPAPAETEAVERLRGTQPCRSPYCECAPGQCSHPGFYDARGTF
jgi:hypothetical protein